MNSLTFILVLACLCQDLVLANPGHVVDYVQYPYTVQLVYPQHKKAKQVGDPAVVEMKSPDGTAEFQIKCQDYESVEAKADIFTKDGVFLDTAPLANVDNPCKSETLQAFIQPQDSTDGLKIVYFWAGKSRACVERTYNIHDESPILARVRKSSHPIVPCPPSLHKYLDALTDKSNPGGITSLAPMGDIFTLDYTANLKTRGKPQTREFPTPDLEGKKFKLICREDELNSEDPVTKKSTILTGSIVHEDNEDVIMEKFVMSDCSIDNINVNRRIFRQNNYFIVVFKKDDGNCYEKGYRIYNIDYLFHFNRVSISHHSLEKVRCPLKYIGDIAKNRHHPILVRMWRWLRGIREEQWGTKVDG